MGTSAETHFVDERGRTCAVLWRSLDGYPTGHGAVLKDLLCTCTLVDRLPGSCDDGVRAPRGPREPRLAVGMPCLAAQAVAYFKGDEPGSTYLQPEASFDLPPDVRYTVYVDRAEALSLRCEVPDWDFDLADPPPPGARIAYSWRVLYDGPVGAFDPDDAEQRSCDTLD